MNTNFLCAGTVAFDADAAALGEGACLQQMTLPDDAWLKTNVMLRTRAAAAGQDAAKMESAPELGEEAR
jgi:hypothetical protein